VIAEAALGACRPLPDVRVVASVRGIPPCSVTLAINGKWYDYEFDDCYDAEKVVRLAKNPNPRLRVQAISIARKWAR